MITPKHAAEKVAPVLSLAAVMLCASTALAQTVTQKCLPPQVIPLTGTEPAAKIVIDPPLAQPLASPRSGGDPGTVRQNLRVRTGVRPGRSGRLAARGPHSRDRRRGAVALGGREWHARSSCRGLPPGPHKVLIELVDANHQPVDKGRSVRLRPMQTLVIANPRDERVGVVRRPARLAVIQI